MMKFLAIPLFLFAFGQAPAFARGGPAPAANHTLEVAAGATALNAEVQDGEILKVVYPFVEKAEPRVEVREESLIYQGACEVMELKNEAPQVEVFFKMPSTIADSGFNGCRMAIDRGFASDGSDLLTLDYGYTIWD